jgi:hypothetical protein
VNALLRAIYSRRSAIYSCRFGNISYHVPFQEQDMREKSVCLLYDGRVE